MGVTVGTAVGLAVGARVGVRVGVFVGGAPSFNVKLDMILTVVCDGAQPPMMVTTPEPAAGITKLPVPAIRLPLHPPPVKDPLEVSNTYSPDVLEIETVSVSPGT